MSVTALLTDFLAIHPEFARELQDNMDQKDLVSISSLSFVSKKNKILVARCIVMNSVRSTHDQRRQAIENILSSEKLEDTISSMQRPRGPFSFITSLLRSNKPVKVAEYLANKNMDLTDAQFLSSLDEILGQEPLLQEAITNVVELAEGYFQRKIDSIVNDLVHRAVKAQESVCKLQIDRDAQSRQETRQKDSRKQFIDDIKTQNKEDL